MFLEIVLLNLIGGLKILFVMYVWYGVVVVVFVVWGEWIFVVVDYVFGVDG